MGYYRIEHTHTITDVYYIEADNKEEAEDMFYDGEFDEPDESYETPDTEETVEITIDK